MRGAPQIYDRKAIRKMRWAGESLDAIAKVHGCHFTTVHKICRDIPVLTQCSSLGVPGKVAEGPIRSDLSSFRHDPALVAEIFSLRGKESATVIAKRYGLASRNVVIGIWNRARDRGAAA